VQWHPETGSDGRLFDALIAAAEAQSGSGGRAARAARPDGSTDGS
jgi:hypothetical protein